MAKILISAGEASGDVHAAAVTKALKKSRPFLRSVRHGRRLPA